MIENIETKLSGQEPITRKELFELVNSWGRIKKFYTNDYFTIEQSEPKECYPLENLDVSQITDFSFIFYASLYNGDLSKWDISNSTSLNCMFSHSNFNNDSLKNWNTSKVLFLSAMFYYSEFNGDISNWNTNNFFNTNGMFSKSNFNNNSICNWNTENIRIFDEMFEKSLFKQDISNWNIKNALSIQNFLNKTPMSLELDIPTTTTKFINWFEANKEKIKEINTTKEEILDFFSFNSNLNKDIQC